MTSNPRARESLSQQIAIEVDPPGERNPSKMTPIKSSSTTSSVRVRVLNEVETKDKTPRAAGLPKSDHLSVPNVVSNRFTPVFSTLPPQISTNARTIFRHPLKTPVETSFKSVSLPGRGTMESFLHTMFDKLRSSIADVFID